MDYITVRIHAIVGLVRHVLYLLPKSVGVVQLLGLWSATRLFQGLTVIHAINLVA